MLLPNRLKMVQYQFSLHRYTLKSQNSTLMTTLGWSDNT
jgi:hypothetical protein